jgi:putative aldouronate transport system permease protein
LKRLIKKNRINHSGQLLLLSIPALLYFTIFNYLPMFGIILAFKSYSYNLGILGSEWIGLKNFEFFFTSQDAWRITRNTVGYGGLFIITGIIASVAIAILLFEIKKKIAIKSYQTIMILPHFLSWVIVSYFTYTLFQPEMGILNQILIAFDAKGIDWYSEPKYWPYILPIVNMWKTVGMNCIIYYAALMGIDSELFEAAKLDGATKVQQIFNISIPSLIPVITILFIMSIGNIFRGDFGLFYQIPRNMGALYPTTDIIDTYVYRGLRTGDIGITSAVGLFQSIVGLALVVGTNAIVKRFNPENSMF